MIEIPQKRGYVTIVDDEDIDLAQRRWNGDYAKSNGETLHLIIMERILGRPLLPSEEVDHKDTNTRNNRRSNLRLATRSQNNMNRRKSPLSQSVYKGVRKCGKDTWEVTIGVNKKLIYIGRFHSLEEAYQARCEAAKKYHGEFARFE